MPSKAIPRGKYNGRRFGGEPQNVAAHFIKCPICGDWIDMRDLGQVLAHEGRLPHPPEDQAQ